MGRIVVVGAGIAGLGCAMLLAGDGQEVIVLERSSHWPFQDDPQAVERALLPFLSTQLGVGVAG